MHHAKSDQDTSYNSQPGKGTFRIRTTARGMAGFVQIQKGGMQTHTALLLESVVCRSSHLARLLSHAPHAPRAVLYVCVGACVARLHRCLYVHARSSHIRLVARPCMCAQSRVGGSRHI